LCCCVDNCFFTVFLNARHRGDCGETAHAAGYALEPIRVGRPLETGRAGAT